MTKKKSKGGRPKGSVMYNINEIFEAVTDIPETTDQITIRLKKLHPTIHAMTVLKYLEKLQKNGYVEEMHKSKTGGWARTWRRIKN